MYTGLPATAVLLLVSLLSRFQLKYFYGWSVSCVSLTDQVFLTLMKLRLNVPTLDLAARFNCSATTVSNIFITITAALHELLFEYFMSTIPSTNKNRSCLPECFSSFCNCRLIMDCTEIYIAVPRDSMQLQRATYSHYKGRNTFKALVCVAPNGAIVFASKLYAGCATDKDIVQHSRILNHMVAGDLILADKGFLISDLLPNGVSLNIPPFLHHGRFTSAECCATRTIARARIHEIEGNTVNAH
jgi:hypothetical protein